MDLFGRRQLDETARAHAVAARSQSGPGRVAGAAVRKQAHLPALAAAAQRGRGRHQSLPTQGHIATGHHAHPTGLVPMRGIGQQFAVQQHIARGGDVDHAIALDHRVEAAQVTQIDRRSRTAAIDHDAALNRNRLGRALALASHDLHAIASMDFAVNLHRTGAGAVKLARQNAGDPVGRHPGARGQHGIHKSGGRGCKRQAPRVHASVGPHGKAVAVDEQQIATHGACGASQAALQRAVDLHAPIAHHVDQPVGPRGHHHLDQVARAHLKQREMVERIAIAQAGGGHSLDARLRVAQHGLCGRLARQRRDERGPRGLGQRPRHAETQRHRRRQRQLPHPNHSAAKAALGVQARRQELRGVGHG